MLWLHAQHNAVQDGVALAFSLLGSARGTLPIALVFSGVLYRVRRRLSWFALLSLVGVALLNVVMKVLLDRPRPTL